MTLIGPFSQLITLEDLPLEGPLHDDQITIHQDSGIIVKDGFILEAGPYQELTASNKIEIEGPAVAIPGLIDAHTHLCWAGSRARDYALRVSGVTYQEIAKRGGGILDTVEHTRAALCQELVELMQPRMTQQIKNGVTTCEVKSGYGLTVEDELKMLRAIHEADQKHPLSLIPTCLAAHTCPKEFKNTKDYLNHLIEYLLPKIQNLTTRIDIFIEEGAFAPQDALPYLEEAKKQGYDLTIHANQFTHAGASVAAKINALSADHLEHLTDDECVLLKKHGVTAVALPGASLGLGLAMPPARKMLDHGLCLAIASDWNPGSAPMGNLLAQAAILGASEKLSLAETLTAITSRSAKALKLTDRGIIKKGARADLCVYPTTDWKDIFYYQGSLTPSNVFIGGIHVDRTH